MIGEAGAWLDDEGLLEGVGQDDLEECGLRGAAGVGEALIADADGVDAVGLARGRDDIDFPSFLHAFELAVDAVGVARGAAGAEEREECGEDGDGFMSAWRDGGVGMEAGNRSSPPARVVCRCGAGAVVRGWECLISGWT
jgi:hypothetical protein